MASELLTLAARSTCKTSTETIFVIENFLLSRVRAIVAHDPEQPMLSNGGHARSALARASRFNNDLSCWLKSRICNLWFPDRFICSRTVESLAQDDGEAPTRLRVLLFNQISYVQTGPSGILGTGRHSIDPMKFAV